MNIETAHSRSAWAIPQVKPARKTVIAGLVSASTCKIRIEPGTHGWTGIEIVLTGPLADLPSMKNSKMPGRSFMNPAFRLRLDALDQLVRLAMTPELAAALPSADWLHLTVINAKRSRKFDVLNCLETVQDWLEPSTKQVGKARRNRGWGIGLLANDSQVVSAHALRSEMTKFPMNETRIILRHWSLVSEFVNRATEALALEAP